MLEHHTRFWMVLLVGIGLLTVGLSTATANAATPSSQINRRQGLLIDLGRHPMTEPDLKQVIRAAAGRRINYLALHLSDNEHLSFQSKYLGNRASKTVLSPAALRRLVTYANARHVQLVPDVDVPSHAGAILRQLKKARPKTYRAVKLDRETLNYTRKQTNVVVKAIYRELDSTFRHQRTHDFILGADEVPGNTAAYHTLTTFINDLNRYQNQRGYATVIWNDSILKRELLRLNKNIVVNYWSQSGNHSETRSLQDRKAKRASVPNLVKAKRKIVNTNSYAAYYQLKYIGNQRHDDYFINYLKNRYRPNLFNEIDKHGQNQNRTLERGVKTNGTLVCLWGHDSKHISTKQIIGFIQRLTIPK